MRTRDARPDPAGRFFCPQAGDAVPSTVGFLTEARAPGG
jgi:hypothetical protein